MQVRKGLVFGQNPMESENESWSTCSRQMEHTCKGPEAGTQLQSRNNTGRSGRSEHLEEWWAARLREAGIRSFLGREFHCSVKDG